MQMVSAQYLAFGFANPRDLDTRLPNESVYICQRGGGEGEETSLSRTLAVRHSGARQPRVRIRKQLVAKG